MDLVVALGGGGGGGGGGVVRERGDRERQTERNREGMFV